MQRHDGRVGTSGHLSLTPVALKALLLATSLVVTLGASCTGTGTQGDPPSPGSGSLPVGQPSTPEVSDSPTPEQPKGRYQVTLAGTSWVLTIVDGGDWPIGGDPRVTLAFHGTRLTWSAGCNSHNARWKMVDGHLELGRIATILSTLVKCERHVERIEGRLARILSASPAVGNGGVTELRLTSSDGVLVFDRSD